MIDFIQENSELITMVLLLVVELVIFLFRIFRKKESPVLNILSDMLPGWIKDAEVQFPVGNGERKRQYVLEQVEKYYEKLTGSKIKLTGILYRSFVNRIEDILGTPQKKGKNL